MNSIFLIDKENPGQSRPVRSVYTPDVVTCLRVEAGLVADAFINRDTIEEYLPLAASADYAFSTWSMPLFSKEEVAHYFPNLKAVFYSAGSVKHFAKPFLENGVRIFSAYAANAIPVAQYCAAQIVLACKGFFPCCKAADMADYKQMGMTAVRRFPGNYHTKVGLLGAGAIGRLVIDYLAPYEPEIFVFDPFLTDEAAKKLGVTKASLADIFQHCTVISNHLADVPETKQMIDRSLLERMAPHTTLINTGRGAQLDHAALCAKLRRDPSVTALLDVTEPEPPVDGSLLYNLPNCILTPHIAGSSGRELERLSRFMLASFRQLVRGETPDYEITEAMLANMA